jgi:hypothetical protein
MPAYKYPRPVFDRETVQEYIKVFLSNSTNANTFKTLSCVKPCTPLSQAIEAFKEHTNVPLQLPLMGFLHLVGTWLMKQDSVIECKGKKLNPDLWTIALASSGAGKTFAFSQLQKASEQVLNTKAEFDAVASAAAYIQELSDKNRSLWFADEFAQFLGQVEQVGSPLAQCKEYLLKTYDGNPIQRKTKLETIEIEKPVLSIFGVNTLDSYLAKVSEESFTDGFAQRFAYILAEPDEARPFQKYTWYDETAIQTELVQAFQQIATTTIHKTYVLSPQAFEAYEQAFQSLLKYEVSESFYRRLMFRSFKYMQIFHVIHGDNSDIITRQDVGWAMRMIELHLLDLKKLLEKYNYSDLAKLIKKVEAKQADFAQKGKSFGTREVIQYCRTVRSTTEAKAILDFVNSNKSAAPMQTPVPAPAIAQVRKAALTPLAAPYVPPPCGQDPVYKLAA